MAISGLGQIKALFVSTVFALITKNEPREQFRYGVFVFLSFLAVAFAVGWSIVRRGFSARDEPSSVEKFVARRVRRLAVPARARGTKNPVSPRSDEATAGRSRPPTLTRHHPL